MILFICLIMILTYSCLIMVSVEMMKDVQSQSKSIHKHLQIEQNQLNQIKKQTESMKKDLLNSCQDRKRKSYNVEQPFQSFIISSLFVILILSIHSGYILSNEPNVYYTLILGVFLISFSLFVLFKILIQIHLFSYFLFSVYCFEFV